MPHHADAQKPLPYLHRLRVVNSFVEMTFYSVGAIGTLRCIAHSAQQQKSTPFPLRDPPLTANSFTGNLILPSEVLLNLLAT